MGALGIPFLVQGETVGGGHRGEIIMIPVEVVTVILDAEAEAMGLGHVDTAIITEGERGGGSDAGDLMVGGDLEAGARDEGGAAFAGHSDEVGVGLGLRTTALHEVRLSVGGEDKMVGGDETPGTDLFVHDADHGGLALELGDIPDGLAQGQIIGTGGFADDLAADDELDGGLAGMIATGDQETDERMREFERG